jgi:hypothetical protein
MIGVSAALAELTKIAAGLPSRSGARPVRAAGPLAAPAELPIQLSAPAVPIPEVKSTESQPSAPPSVDVSASAIERLRSSIPRSERSVPLAEEVPLSPNGQPPQQAGPSAESPTRAGAAPTADAPREPRLDFLIRQRSAARPTPPQPESFDALWPKRPGREPQGNGRAEPRVEPTVEPRVEEQRAAAAATTSDGAAAVEVRAQSESPTTASPDVVPRSVAILKSGVVDGMAYTLYADGSIEAQLAEGTVRFGSIAELRAHIEKNS